jgi:hypothetical protein
VTAESPPGRLARCFAALVAHRLVGILLVLGLTGGLGYFAAQVRPDYSIELLFPTFDRSRREYEHFKRLFPFEDAHALVVVEAADLFTPAGIRRVAALEESLARIPGVLETQGLTTVRDLVEAGETIKMERLFPKADLPPEEIARRRATATTDPLFAWTLAHPDGHATTIRVTLTKEQAGKDALRTEFMLRARKVLAEHDASARAAGATQRLTLNGLPVIRSEFTEMINLDLGRLFPVALLLILVLLWVAFRSVGEVLAALLTIIFSAVWSAGVMGLAGVPLHVLTQITPIIVMIISISDTVHLVDHARECRAAGQDRRRAIVAALADGAVPCLLTEITIAGGFLSLIANDMVAIQQFGLVTAAGVLLAWVANVTVLPLALSFVGLKAAPVTASAPATTRALARFIAGIENVVVRRPGRVVLVTLLITVGAVAIATRVGREYYSYDDLRPRSQLARNLRYVEKVHGGVVPMAIHVEVKDPAARKADAMLEPAALALLDRLTQKTEAELPGEVRNAASLSKYLRKAHRLLAGAEIARESPLPKSRALAVQELLAIDDPAALRNLVSFDRSAASIYVMMPDHGSSRATKVIARLNRVYAAEAASTPYQVTLTGIYGIADGIYRSMVGGFLLSLGIAVLVSFGVFCLVLRSWRLGLLALVPNVLPLVLTLGLMSLLRIDVKPTTVLIFSITLVIADDDTIQYLSRFRARFMELLAAGDPDPHRGAALGVLRQTGLPMLVTTVAVTLGFLTLMLSEFLALANLGLLIGVSLLTAVFADLFLSPLMIIKLRPRLGGRRAPPTEEVPEP